MRIFIILIICALSVVFVKNSNAYNGPGGGPSSNVPPRHLLKRSVQGISDIMSEKLDTISNKRREKQSVVRVKRFAPPQFPDMMSKLDRLLKPDMISNMMPKNIIKRSAQREPPKGPPPPNFGSRMPHMKPPGSQDMPREGDNYEN